jgi:hypothetical protein
LNLLRGRIVVLGVFVIGLALAGWAVLSLGHEGNDFALASPGELYGNTRFGQTFVASHSNLHRIDVVMSTYGRRNTQSVIFHLKRGLDAKVDIVTMPFHASDVRDEAWRSFTFPPLPDSAGQWYYLYLESPKSEPGNAITVMGREGDPYPLGQAYIDSQPFPGDMAFRVYYKVNPIHKINIVLTSLAANKPAIWGSKHLYSFLVVVYVLLVAALIWEISGDRAWS